MQELSILKYYLSSIDRQKIKMPQGAEILSIQLQRGTITLWAVVDPTAALIEREFVLLGECAPIKDRNDLRYIGTVQNDNGSLVWHVFLNK